MSGFRHVLRGLFVVLGLIASDNVFSQARQCGFFPLSQLQAALGGATITLPDDGEAIERCNTDRNSRAPYWWDTSQGFGSAVTNPSGACVKNAAGTAFSLTFVEAGAPLVERSTCQNHPTFVGQVASRNIRTYNFIASCSTRKSEAGSWSGYRASPTVCHKGCLYENSICIGGACTGGGNTEWFASGPTCTGGAPRKPDTDSDGEPDETDDAPTDPGCRVNCGPDDPEAPEEPEPEPPNDGQDDGAQIAGVLGPKLDAIKQAVDTVGTKVDAVQSAINQASADANTDADRIVNAINTSSTAPTTVNVNTDALQAAIQSAAADANADADRIVEAIDNTNGEGDGDGEGQGDSTIDLSEAAQDPDTSSLVDSIWQSPEDARIELDTAGFGGSRSCPLLTMNIPPWMGSHSFVQVCNVLQLLSHLLFALSALWGLSIVWERT